MGVGSRIEGTGSDGRSILALARDLLTSLWAVTGRRRAWVLVLLTTALALEAGLLALLVPTFGAVLGGPGAVGSVVGGEPGATDLARLALLLAAVAGVVLARGALVGARDMGLLRAQLGYADDERRRILRVLAFAGWSRVARIDHARLTAGLTSEIQRVSVASEALLRALVALPSLILQVGFAIALAPGFTLVVLAAGAGAGLVALGGQRALFELGRAVTEAHRATFAGLHGLLGSLKAAAAQRSQRALIAELDTVQAGLIAQQLDNRARRLRRGRLLTMFLMAILAATILLGLGVFRLSPDRIALLLFVFLRMTLPAIQIVSALQTSIVNLPALAALRALEAEIGSAAEPADHELLPPLPGPLALAGVTYRHIEGPGIADVDLTVAPGSIVAVTGMSGHGKTTLLDIIAGLLEPQAGTIAVGGQALAGAARDRWSAQLAYVPQDGFLFPDTVRRNLAWGNGAVDEAAMSAAIATVGADAIVARLGGLDAVIGQPGARLSGGERQRLLIARALLRKPRWLILDEATNALDEAAETALLDRLAALADRPTIVLTSHRPEVAARCDRIVRVSGGRVAAG